MGVFEIGEKENESSDGGMYLPGMQKKRKDRHPSLLHPKTEWHEKIYVNPVILGWI